MLIGKALEKLGRELQTPGPIVNRALSTNRVTCDDLLESRYPWLRPLQVYAAPTPRRRVNIITDSVSAGSLFGGVGTAIVFAALVAEHLGATLRVITRTEKPDRGRVHEVLKRNAVQWSENIDFAFADVYKHRSQVDAGADELFITTSWWTTWSTKASVDERSIIYLLQEDERTFYPFGDEHLRCSELLASTAIRFVVNSRLLFEHFVNDGLDNIARRGVWFEPAFPARIPRSKPRSADGRLKLFFYARPNNARNLFYLGIEVLDEAIRHGILDLNKWEVHFVGKDVPPIVFSNGYSPHRAENLTWGAYFELIATMDVGFCLMYSPHPSYPPLDLAAAGALVVTNRYGRKEDLSRYSSAITCSELAKDDLVTALAKALDQAGSSAAHEKRGDRLLTDWRIAFQPVLSHLFQ
jgi:hypothetical protein